MANGWNEFYAVVFEDAELTSSLRAIDDPVEFVNQIVLQAQNRGYTISSEEVENALMTQRRIWAERWLDR